MNYVEWLYGLRVAWGFLRGNFSPGYKLMEMLSRILYLLFVSKSSTQDFKIGVIVARLFFRCYNVFVNVGLVLHSFEWHWIMRYWLKIENKRWYKMMWGFFFLIQFCATFFEEVFVGIYYLEILLVIFFSQIVQIIRR